MPRRIRALHDAVHECVPLSWTITMVDVEAGDDEPWPWAAHLTEQLRDVHLVQARHAGRVAALKAAWRHTRSEIVVLLELDTPAALDAVLPLVVPLVRGRAEVAVGSVRGGRRGWARRAFNGLLRLGFGADDPRSELVAARSDVLWPLLSKIKDDTLFLSTELMLLARHNRLRVREVPIDPDTRPGPIRRPLWPHFWALIRLSYAIVTGRADVPPFADGPGGAASFRATMLMKFFLFGVVGGLSGVLYVLVYLPLRDVSSPAVANFAALVAAALFNSEINRIWTFRRAKVARLGMHVKAFVLFAIHYALTTGAVLVLLLLDPDAGRTAELITLLSADLLMTVGRFIGLDKWVFRQPR